MAITLKYPSELGTEITAIGSDGWLVGQTAAGVTGKLHPGGISIAHLASAASGGASTQIWNASKVYLPSNGEIGYWNGSAWQSRLKFNSSGGLELFSTSSNYGNFYCSSVIAPYFQFDGSNYIYEYSANVMGFYVNGAARCAIGTNGSFLPGVNNSMSIGGANPYLWAAIYAANGTIQTSDAREKTDIADTDLGLDFVLALRPVKFRWIVGGNVVTPAEIPGGEPTVTAVPGARTHYGLLAQEVKTALGERDFGGWVEDAETGQQALRYDQFINPLIKAIQELEARVAALEGA